MSETGVIDFGSMDVPTLSNEAVETPEVQEVETPEAVETPSEEVEGTEPKGDTPEGTGKGKSPSLKQIRDAVKAYEAANPEQGKVLRSLLDGEGRHRAFSELFSDGVDGARSLKAAVDAAGGVSGLTELVNLKSHVDEINERWDSGDPSALDVIFEDNSEGPIKLLPHYMNRVEKANPEAFGAALKPHLVRNLSGAGFDRTVSGILKVLANTNATPEQKLAAVQDSVESMAQWFNDQKTEAEKTNLDSLEPGRKKLDERESKLTEREYKQFEGEVQSDVRPHINELFGKNMSAYSKALAALPSDAMRQNVAKAWLEELGKAFGKEHHDHMATMMKSRGRNKTAIANYAKTRMSAVAEAVTKKIVDAYKLTPGKVTPGKKAAGGGKDEKLPDSGVFTRVNQRPPDEQIDWDRDPNQMLFITGKAYLKGSNGQRGVRWR